AIGASRFRIVRQLLTENLVLSFAGGLAGLAGAYWGLRALLSFAPPDLPRFDEASIDANVLAFTALVSILTAVFFGLIPTLYATRGNLSGCLKGAIYSGGSGRVQRRFGSALVVFEIAAAFTLMAGAGLLLQSFMNILQVPAGFDPESVLVM